MPTVNPTGFCPRCNQNVLLTRQEIDTCLAVVLLIFTAGIGLIIYLIWYYSRPEVCCIHCGYDITTSLSQNQFSYDQQQQVSQIAYNEKAKKVTGNLPNFCSLCGEKLEAGIKYCPNCGSKV